MATGRNLNHLLGARHDAFGSNIKYSNASERSRKPRGRIGRAIAGLAVAVVGAGGVAAIAETYDPGTNNPITKGTGELQPLPQPVDSKLTLGPNLQNNAIAKNAAADMQAASFATAANIASQAISDYKGTAHGGSVDVVKSGDEGYVKGEVTISDSATDDYISVTFAANPDGSANFSELKAASYTKPGEALEKDVSAFMYQDADHGNAWTARISNTDIAPDMYTVGANSMSELVDQASAFNRVVPEGYSGSQISIPGQNVDVVA